MAGHIFFSLLNPVIAAIFATMFLLLWRRFQAHRHFGLLALAFLLLAAGFAFYDFSPLGSEVANRLISNIAFAAAIIIACCAALQRSRIPIPFAAFAALLIPGYAAFVWFLVLVPSIDARIVIVGLIFSGLFLISVTKLLQAGPSSTPDRLIVAAGILGAILPLARPILILLGILDAADGPTFRESSYWLSLQAFSPILSGTVALLFLSAMTMDMVDRLKAEANHDYLTGLLNRRGFESAIGKALLGNRHSALLIADIDDFKQVNDRFGHKVGDLVIAGVARALSSHSGAKFAARVGGEEFALYYDHSDQDALQRHAEAIRAAVRHMVVGGLPKDYNLTLSIGLHTHGPGQTLSDMLIEADRALYRAKRDGKDRAVTSRAPLHSFKPKARLA
ncbi:GGDEF domain-containing protein [Devosia faecipullorum]|uniref:GGDEF domain-containing protein n=1 Tax=Devosia faecipullorum TaxID=2755039 RepID=UPI00187BA5F5|nr:diguanylate cyclase [Devosia faecipullorum]MBE7731695.1 GGDEF domain-containing protein [Devosia faecipullorum]